MTEAKPEIQQIAGEPLSTERSLTVFERADLLASGLTREQAADMTPDALAELADYSVATSNLFLGS